MRVAHNFVDLTGQVFGRLTVSRRAESYRGQARWHCRCSCGGSTITNTQKLKSGHTKSCGCIPRERASKHGKHKHPTYTTYHAMLQRCHNPKSSRYSRYGARGITVCDRWRESFENFLEDMGDRTKGYTLDRIDNDGNYTPDNCRWADLPTQYRNRSQTVWLELNGETKCVTDWCAEYGIDTTTFTMRLKRGWDMLTALTAPPYYQFSRALRKG